MRELTSTSGYTSHSRRGLKGDPTGRYVSRNGMYRQVREALGLSGG